MRILKNKSFSKWAAKESIRDGALAIAVEEMARGLVDAELGGHVFKKRVATGGRGKSSGVRTLLGYMDRQLEQGIGNDALIEVNGYEENNPERGA